LKLLLLGATGLVGSHVLQQALRDGRIEAVTAPVRRAIPSQGKLNAPKVDFDRLPRDAGWWKADAVICALGTTRRKAGSAEAFRSIDHDLIVETARLAHAAGTPTFALVSAKGANRRSPLLYPRVKGETEEDVAALGFRSLTVLRPGLIGGNRSEHRTAERLSMVVLGFMKPVLPKGWTINPAERIAARLIEAAVSAAPGHHLVGSSELV
jgi:uncharacterized protein YbjT (DUF2867 family)